jgi:hypothetical protein
MSDISLKGSCLCGTFRYTAKGEAKRFYHCHCQRCRKVTGTGHASNLFLKGALEWDTDPKELVTYKVPEAERFTNTFCPYCGSRMPRYIEAAGVVMIPAGSLDEEPPIAPQARIFTGSRAAWSCDRRDIVEFEEYPG